MNETMAKVLWQEACASALCGLPEMGPARLAALLSDIGPESAWQSLAEGRPVPDAVRRACGSRAKDVVRTWWQAAAATDPMVVAEAYRSRGVGIWTRFGDYPDRLLADPWAPVVLFWQGDPAALAHPTVAIIGTRDCSPEGREIARALGGELASAGVSVVSGLALGVDGAAHRGAVDSGGAPPIGVVGSGLDVPYPKRNLDLWRSVAECGLLLSEAALGSAPQPWRFPARNRVIAGLADLVVVVESHERGGSLLTVDQAILRGVPVMAVPGSVRNPAARGSNQLLRDGCAPVCSVDDVLVALSLAPGRRLPAREQRPLDPDDRAVLEAVGWEPTTTGTVLERTGWSVLRVASALARLEGEGWIESDGACWWRAAEMS